MKEKRVIKDSFIQKVLIFVDVLNQVSVWLQQLCMIITHEKESAWSVGSNIVNETILKLTMRISHFFAFRPCFRRAVHGRNSAILGGAPITQFYVLIAECKYFHKVPKNSKKVKLFSPKRLTVLTIRYIMSM